MVEANNATTLCANMTSGTGSKYVWTFYTGNGELDKETTTSCVDHTFPAAGSHPVRVVATPTPELGSGYVVTETAFTVVEVGNHYGPLIDLW